MVAFVYQHVSLAAEASRTPSAPSVGVLGASVDEDALEQAGSQPQLMRPLCSLLLAFSKEKHTPVRTNSELALVEILLVRWPSHSKQVQVFQIWRIGFTISSLLKTTFYFLISSCVL